MVRLHHLGKLVCAALCLAFAQSATAASAPRRVVLIEKAEIVGPRWTLGDVATLHGFDAQEAAALSRQLASPSPALCETLRIDRAVVERRLRQLSGLASRDLVVEGSSTLAIHRPCQTVDAATLQAVAAHALSPRLAAHSARFDLIPSAAGRPVEVPLGKVTLAARNVPEHELISPRLQVWVDIDVDERSFRSVPVVFEVHAFGPAWIATRDARAGEAVEAAQLERREIDLAGLRAAMPAKDQRLKRPLLAGQALTESHVERIPTVERGSIVTVRSSSHGIAVEVRGEAMQQGGVGQRIWIRVATSTAPISGLVLEPSVVEVQHE